MPSPASPPPCPPWSPPTTSSSCASVSLTGPRSFAKARPGRKTAALRATAPVIRSFPIVVCSFYLTALAVIRGPIPANVRSASGRDKGNRLRGKVRAVVLFAERRGCEANDNPSRANDSARPTTEPRMPCLPRIRSLLVFCAVPARTRNQGEHAMRRITKCLAVLGAVLTLSAASARAEQPASAEPVKLSDQDLDRVSGGDGSLLNLNAFLNITLKNIFVTVNVSNVPINAGVAVQANALGTAAQTATVQALQSVTQLQTMPGLQ